MDPQVFDAEQAVVEYALLIKDEELLRHSEWMPNTPEGLERLRQATQMLTDAIDDRLDCEFISPPVCITAQARQPQWHTYPDD